MMNGITVHPQANNPFWDTLTNKRILVVGAGKTGLSAVHFLAEQKAQVTLWDMGDSAQLPDSVSTLVDRFLTGNGDTVDWVQFDGVVLSPGVSPHHQNLSALFALSLPIIGDIELFALALKRRKHQPKLIGVTGSNGKTTVTLLIEHILQTAQKSVLAVGNVGQAALNSADEQVDFMVLELSSFQLEMTSSLQLDVGCYLNLSEDHLDRHGTLDAYGQIKQRIFHNTRCGIYWADQSETHPQSALPEQQDFSVNPTTQAQWQLDDHQRICFQSQPVVDASVSPLVGLHNIRNLQAAVAAVGYFGIAPAVIEQALRSFQPPAHRCVTVLHNKGIHWIDDSKATNPGATLAALEGIGPLVKGRLILIAGGDAKGAELGALAQAMESYVDVAITLGKDGDKFSGLAKKSVAVESLPQAVEYAESIATSGDQVLLSPACASIDMFDNYIQRAQVFADAVKRVAA